MICFVIAFLSLFCWTYIWNPCPILHASSHVVVSFVTYCAAQEFPGTTVLRPFDRRRLEERRREKEEEQRARQRILDKLAEDKVQAGAGHGAGCGVDVRGAVETVFWSLEGTLMEYVYTLQTHLQYHTTLNSDGLGVPRRYRC